MIRITKTEILAMVAIILTIYLSISTMDYQTEIEQENVSLKAEVKKLRAQVADPPKLCREHYRKLMKEKK